MLWQSLCFSCFLPNHPHPLSSFDTHARWQLLMQSARSRRSYGKIGDCEQSTLRWTKLTSLRHPQLSSFCFFPLAIIKCKNSLLFDLIPKAVVLVIYTCWIRRTSHSQTWFKHGGKTWRKTQKSSCRILDISCAPVEIKVSKNEIIKQKTDPYSLGETHDFNSFPSKGCLFWFPLTFTLTHAHTF